MTIGLERPRPGRLVLQAIFGSLGMVASEDAPEDAGPRKCGQSEAIIGCEPTSSAVMAEIATRAANALERPMEGKVG